MSDEPFSGDDEEVAVDESDVVTDEPTRDDDSAIVESFTVSVNGASGWQPASEPFSTYDEAQSHGEEQVRAAGSGSFSINKTFTLQKGDVAADQDAE